MRKRRTTNLRGVSLVELLVASILLVVVASVAYNFYIFAKNVWAHTSAQGNLQRDAMLGLEKMIHGVDADHKGIHEAQAITTPGMGVSATQVEFTDGADAALSRRFYISGDALVYEDENNNNVNLIDENVKTLTFTRSPITESIITINIVLEKVALDKTISVDLETIVRARNM